MTLNAANPFTTTTSPAADQYSFTGGNTLRFGSNASSAGVVILSASGNAINGVTTLTFSDAPNQGDAVIIINNSGVVITWADTLCEIGDNGNNDPTKTYNGMGTLFVYNGTGWSCVAPGGN